MDGHVFHLLKCLFFENYYGIPSPPKKPYTIHNLEIEFQSNYTTAKAEKIVQLRR